MVTAKQVINSTKPNLTKVPQGATKLGSAGYDNVRDDIEKVKKIREGSVEKVPANDNDITNKKYVDDQFPVTHASTTGRTSSDHHVKYTDAEAVSAVLTADDYLKNFENDSTTYKLTIGEVQVDKININDDDITTADAGENENGDDINITTGAGGTSNPPGSGYDGGDINITSGNGGGFGPGDAGAVNITSGTGDTTGAVNIKSGSGGSTAGNINITAQNSGTGDLGEVHIKGTIVGGGAGVLYLQEDAGGIVVGDSGAHAGIKFYLQGDDGGVVASPSVCQFLGGTARAANDGNDSIFEATNAGTGDQNGGDIIFNAGAKTGTGANGKAIMNNNLDVIGAISSGTATITTSSDAVDVGGVNTVFCDTSSNAIVIGGFANGVTGQKLLVVKTSSSNSLKLEHNEATGTQKIMMHQAADETISANDFGGYTLVFNGTYWFDISHARHV